MLGQNFEMVLNKLFFKTMSSLMMKLFIENCMILLIFVVAKTLVSLMMKLFIENV